MDIAASSSSARFLFCTLSLLKFFRVSLTWFWGLFSLEIISSNKKRLKNCTSDFCKSFQTFSSKSILSTNTLSPTHITKSHQHRFIMPICPWIWKKYLWFLFSDKLSSRHACSFNWSGCAMKGHLISASPGLQQSHEINKSGLAPRNTVNPLYLAFPYI